jgi:hypothetical protein
MQRLEGIIVALLMFLIWLYAVGCVCARFTGGEEDE